MWRYRSASVKIDLKQDRGILSPQKFITEASGHVEMSEDEIIAETLRRRHTGAKPDDVEATPEDNQVKPETTRSKKSGKKQSARNRNPVRELILLVIMVSLTVYYLHDKGILFSTMDMARDYAYGLLGIDPVLPEEEDDLDQYDEYFSGDSLLLDAVPDEGVLTDEAFNELMPLTPELAALKDSMAAIKPDSLYVRLPDGRDTAIVYQEMPSKSEELIELSDDDIKILNNRSLLLMVTEIISNYPLEYGSGNIFLKRDALTVTAPGGGEWVRSMRQTIDKFAAGNFNEDFSSGTARITSKFELVMNAEPDFVAQSFDAMRLLDLLANPFSDYLDEIIIDPALETNDNPVKLSFTGSLQEIQFILSSWAESRSNFLIQSIEIDFQHEILHLEIGVLFFNYTP